MSDNLLIQPPFPPPMDAYVKDVVLCPPLGLAYIASLLREHKYSIRVVDAAIRNLTFKKIAQIIEHENPKHLFISAATYTFKNAIKIAATAKEIDEKIYTVLGGPHVTFKSEDALKDTSVDAVVRGEGEYTTLELVKALSLKRTRIKRLSQIQGLSFKTPEGQFIHTPDRPYINDLDVLPFPARDLFPLTQYRIPASLITSRGCPYNCVFCAAKALSGGKYRVRSPDNVVSEVKDIITTMNPGFIFVADDTFTVFPDRTEKIALKFKDMGVNWICESRVNTVNRKMIKLLAECGCFALQFGVETGSQKILDSICKGITIEQVRDAVRGCIEEGIQPVCSFMVPHPEDTWDTISETETFMEELKRWGVQIFVSLTTPFPGTVLYEEAETYGVRFLSDDTDDFNLATPVIETNHFTVKEVEEIFDRFVKISIATLPATLR